MNTKITSLLFLILTTLTWSCEDDKESPRLNPDFTVDRQSVTAGETIAFSDATTGNPSRWNWYFEGGTPSRSILHSPEVVYDVPGTYPVKLVVARGSDSAAVVREDLITVGYPEVQAAFSSDRTSALQGESIAFTDQSAGMPVSWHWTFTSGDVTIESTEQNPVITFEEFGVYTVTLTAVNPDGSDEETKVDYITILDIYAVLAKFTSETRNTYTGANVAFTDQSEGVTVTSWNWTFEGGTPAASTEQNPVVSYSAPGRYKVTLVAGNDQKSSTAEIEDYILVVPGDALASFFPFDGTSDDAGPNKLSETIEGVVTFDGIDHRVATDGAAVFSGAGVIVVADHQALNFGVGDYSVSVWLKTDRSSRAMIWQESGELGSKDNQTWLRLFSNTTTNLIQLATEDETGGAFLGVSEAQGGKLNDNVWHHVVAVRQGGTRRIYVDGILRNEVTSGSAKNVSNSAPFKIGAQKGTGGFNNWYNGLMDDMIIYNRALTDQEVTELFGL